MNNREDMSETEAVTRVVKTLAFLLGWITFNITSCEVIDILKRDTPAPSVREHNLKDDQQEYAHTEKMRRLENELEKIQADKDRPVIFKNKEE